MAATQGETRSAASGEARPKAAAVARGDADGRQRKPAPEVEQLEAPPSPRSGGVLAWIRAHKILTALIAIGLLAAIVGGVLWRLNASRYQTTDDAFIDARPTYVSAEVSAAITDVPVTDNEIVQPGQVLARLDNRDYLAAQAQAMAQIAQAEAAISSADAQTKAQQSAIDQSSLLVTQNQAAIAYSRDQYQRAETML